MSKYRLPKVADSLLPKVVDTYVGCPSCGLHDERPTHFLRTPYERETRADSSKNLDRFYDSRRLAQ